MIGRGYVEIVTDADNLLSVAGVVYAGVLRLEGVGIQ
jgi:hypothetical protein